MSDRSYYPTHQNKTSSCIIKIQNNDYAIIGDNIVPVDAKFQCSHSSELCGLLGDIRHINNICSTCNVLEGSAQLGCDGLEAYKVAKIYTYAPSHKLSHYNSSSIIHQLIKANTLSWKFRHVKGHQDDGGTYKNIDEWGQMNIDAYIIIKDYMWCQINEGATHQPHEAISGSIQPIST